MTPTRSRRPPRSQGEGAPDRRGTKKSAAAAGDADSDSDADADADSDADSDSDAPAASKKSPPRATRRRPATTPSPAPSSWATSPCASSPGAFARSSPNSARWSPSAFVPSPSTPRVRCPAGARSSPASSSPTATPPTRTSCSDRRTRCRRRRAMNMREVDGRHAAVDAAAPSSHANEAAAAAGNKGGDVAYDHTRSVFLGNLPYAVDEEEVIRLFHRNKEYPELSGAVECGSRRARSKNQPGQGHRLRPLPQDGRGANGVAAGRDEDGRPRDSRDARERKPRGGDEGG